ncbi:transcriptional regulator [Lunatibacter salilacus]|uniref:transcriptional regulator n=1 Tax=Lunatibacter salilacus TaxID=2483804 RepID=UPI0018FE27B5|nr:transcriptional regulator [Lunatibacter salilacus]
MEKITINADIHVLAVAAPFFPEGVPTAFDKLHSLLDDSTPRRIFGLSRPEKDGDIVYRAAAEEMSEGEAQQLESESLTIKKGTYISMTVDNYKQDIPAIGRAFEELLEVPNLDPEGYCVELYDPKSAGYGTANESVICMIRLDD